MINPVYCTGPSSHQPRCLSSRLRAPAERGALAGPCPCRVSRPPLPPDAETLNPAALKIWHTCRGRLGSGDRLFSPTRGAPGCLTSRTRPSSRRRCGPPSSCRGRPLSPVRWLRSPSRSLGGSCSRSRVRAAGRLGRWRVAVTAPKRRSTLSNLPACHLFGGACPSG